MQTRIARSVIGLFGSIVFSLFLASPTAVAQAQDQEWVGVERQSARSWGMHRIAVHQAADGDVQGAKRTLSQISDYGPKGPAQVTVVSFYNRQPFCGCLPAVYHGRGPAVDSPSLSLKSLDWGGRDAHGIQYFLVGDRTADRVPTELPADLPSDYLDADPRHGKVVDFADEYDSRGTRVTLRKYADGHAVIETPRTNGQ